MEPWVKKYHPKKSSGIKGQDQALSQLKLFVTNYKSQKKKAILIHGAPGCGKTSAVHAVANESDLEIMEINASDFRNKAKIESTVGASSNQMSLFSKGKIILVDEVDGLAGREDRGGVSAITGLIKTSSFPIVMTANDAWHKKFNSLRKVALMVEFQTLNYLTVFEILKEISNKEKTIISEDRIKSLARRSGGDLRAAINDLQSLHMLGDMWEIEELDERNRTDTMFEALTRIFKSTDPKVALSAFDNVDEDTDQRFLWIDENLPKEYTKPEELAQAYDKISKADVFRGRIRRWQYWRFLVYINQLLSAGVALSKKEKYKGFVKYSQTMRLLKIWQANMKYQRRKSISSKIAAATHTSTKQVINSTFPYVKQIFKSNKQLSEQLAKEFDLDKDDVAYLKK